MRLATEINKYLDVTAPWLAIKTDKEAAAKSVFTALKATRFTKYFAGTFFSHSLVKSSTSISAIRSRSSARNSPPPFKTSLVNIRFYNITPIRHHGSGTPSQLAPGQQLTQPAPLFKKLDEKIVEEERRAIGQLTPFKVFLSSVTHPLSGLTNNCMAA
jgi:methionyl-tRNA synthetase